MSEPISYIVTYNGKVPSSNQLYAGSHWSARKKLKDSFNATFQQLLEAAKVGKVDRYKIQVRYHSRHDADNLSTVVKLFVDSLRAGGYVQDDSPKYFKGLSISYDPTLPKNTVAFTIQDLK